MPNIPAAPFVDKAYEQMFAVRSVGLTWQISLPEIPSTAGAMFNPGRWPSFLKYKWIYTTETVANVSSEFALGLLVWVILWSAVYAAPAA